MIDPQQSSIPDTLFKYVDAKGGLATLEQKMVSVMFSKPSDLNDPFEFLPSLNRISCDPSEFGSDCKYLASPFLSATADYLKQEIELHWFVTSLTTADRNVRMWAQYAGNHSGIKLTFNPASAIILGQKDWMRPVRYCALTRCDVTGLQALNDQKKGELLMQVATHKGPDWEHEKEIRWFLRDDGQQNKASKRIDGGKMRAFVELHHSCIQRVTVGYWSDPSLLRSVLELRKLHNARWEVARAVLSHQSFQFDEEVIPVA